MRGATGGSATSRDFVGSLVLSPSRFAPAMSLRVNIPDAPDNDSVSREIASVSARATEVFGSREKAMRWLYTPLSSFGNRTPISLVSTTNGPADLEDTLGAIEHGIW